MNRSITGPTGRRHVNAASTMRRARVLTMAALIAVAALIPATSVAAIEPTGMVLQWNTNAVAVTSQPATNTPPGLGQGPPLSALHIAMVHGAIYDAVNAIAGGREPYLDGITATGSESQAAAVAQAGAVQGVAYDLALQAAGGRGTSMPRGPPAATGPPGARRPPTAD